jgi:TPP-dependent pyruvate/acetoin dehydrogenase alpha subunit
MNISQARMLEMYYLMVLSRTFEYKLRELYQLGEPTSMTPYLGFGEEAVAVGTALALDDEDIYCPHFRGSAYRLAKGVPIRRLMALWFIREMGLAIQSHIQWNLIWQASTSLGAAVDIAVGASLACKLEGDHRVVVSLFGDGMSSLGNIHESMNFAGVFNLPIVFICVNNQYAMSTATSKSVAVQDIAIRSASYNFPGVIVDGNDVIEVYKITSDAIERARAGQSPTIIEAKTYRMSPHSENDEDQYRSESEKEAWAQRDPISSLEKKLALEGVTRDQIAEINAEVQNEVEDAVTDTLKMERLSPAKIVEMQEQLAREIYRTESENNGELD